MSITVKPHHCCFFFLLSLLCVVFPAFAAEEGVKNYYQQQINTLSQSLETLKNNNNISIQQVEQLRQKFEEQKLQTETTEITKQQLDLINLNFNLAHAELTRLSQALYDAEREHKLTQQLVTRLEERYQEIRLSSQNLTRDKTVNARLEQDIEQQKTLYKLQSEKIRELYKSYDYEEKRARILEDIQQLLTKLYTKHQQYLRDLTFHKLSEQARVEQTNWLKAVAEQSKALEKLAEETTLFSPKSVAIRLRIFELQERVKLSQLTVSLARLEMSTNDLLALSDKIISLPQLNTQLLKIDSAIDDVDSMMHDIENRMELLREHKGIQTQSFKQKLITSEQQQFRQNLLDNLEKQYQQKLRVLQQLEKKISSYQQDLQQKLAQFSTARQGLPGLDWQGWLSLGQKTVELIGKTGKYVASLSDHISSALANNFFSKILLLVIGLMWFLGWFLISRYSQTILAILQKQQTITSNVAYLLMSFLHKNLANLMLFGMGLSLVMICDLPFKYYAAIFYLALVWFIFRFILRTARLLLVERENDVSGNDVRLYRHLKQILLPGAIVTAFTVIAEQLNASAEVKNLTYRLLSLFLFLLSLVLLRGYKVIPNLVGPYIETRPYLKLAIRLSILLVSLTLLSIAGMGLAGYVELAWAMSYYQLRFVFVLTLYVVVRGFLIDLMNVVESLVVRHVKNGWLWSEVLLKPLDRILRVILFIAAWVALFWIYGWWQDSVVVTQLKQILNYQLVAFSGGYITPLSTIYFAILVAVFVWAARWTREFAYRWLFREVKDPGIRNSFSLFSQYAIITVGAVITLRVLGIDFSGMAVILGGLAVGLGFGLREVTSNLVSGLMLLIERPLRAGDTVSIGNFEGDVTHIGLRATTIRSFDHMEVVVPNSEVFNKTFTNWTQEDSVIRTVVPIKIQRNDDPARVRDLIFQVLEQTSGVLKDPAPEIYLKEIDEALIEFEVRYFVNLQKSTRVEVRSRVLFAICQLFKEQHILPPHPQQDIHITTSSTGPSH